MEERPKFNLWYSLILAAILAFGCLVWISQEKEQESSSTPASGSAEASNSAGRAPAAVPHPNPRFSQVMQHIRQIRMQINYGWRNKTIKADQRRNFMNSLRPVISKTWGYVNQQPDRELTAEQQTELNQMLDEISGNISQAQPAAK